MKDKKKQNLLIWLHGASMELMDVEKLIKPDARLKNVQNITCGIYSN